MRTPHLKVVSAVAPAYRASAMGRNGRPMSSVEVEANDDAVAIELTRSLAAFYPVELWHGPRFLGRFALGGEVSSALAEPCAIRPAQEDVNQI